MRTGPNNVKLVVHATSTIYTYFPVEAEIAKALPQTIISTTHSRLMGSVQCLYKHFNVPELNSVGVMTRFLVTTKRGVVLIRLLMSTIA